MKKSHKKLVQPDSLIVGIDIAKHKHWAQIIYQNEDVGKAFPIENTTEGFENLVRVIKTQQKRLGASNVVVGMEPTGHYFKPLAYYLKRTKTCELVLVNPYHVNRTKELDDNSPSKTDPKDARLIAKLISQGHYFNDQLSTGIWAQLRVVNVNRLRLVNKRWQLKNQLITVLDQYFPEFADIFKNILGKGAIHILTHHPLPDDIMEADEQTLCQGLKEATHNRVGQKRVTQIKEAALDSIGIREGTGGARMQIAQLVEELALIGRHLANTEAKMAELLDQTELGQYLTSIPGVGIVSAAAFLAEIGDPNSYKSHKQIKKKAGLNLKENSSGKHKGKTTISKRGRPSLRQLLYQIAFVSVAKNPEMKAIYNHLRTRGQNPLAGKQALIAIAVRMMKIMLAVAQKHEHYDPNKVGNPNSVARLKAA